MAQHAMREHDSPAPGALATARRIAFRALCVLALAAGGCDDPTAGLKPLPDTAAPAYRLAAGDEVKVDTFADRDVSGDFRISETGTIALPLVGTLHAGGMTATELQKAIAERLVQLKLFTNPSVSVEVLEYQPVYVLGNVNNPGRYRYTPGMTVLGAVALAGGFAFSAAQDRFSVSRTEGGHKVEGLATRLTTLRPGDVVEVVEKAI
jgi:polysaccharide export outer membrane protein